MKRLVSSFSSFKNLDEASKRKKKKIKFQKFFRENRLIDRKEALKI